MDIKALQVFGDISTALSRESNVDRILETILLGAKELTNADGATLYSVENDWLQFALIHSNSLNLDLRDNRTVRSCFQPIPLYDEFGKPNTRTVATFCIHSDTTVNIPDAYRARGFDFSGTKEFDRKTGYVSRSFLSVPIKDNTDRAIAVLQLINPKDRDTQAIVSFSVEDQRLVESLATLAAVALEKHHLTRYRNVLTGSLYVHDSNGELHLSRAHFVALLEACGLAHDTRQKA